MKFIETAKLAIFCSSFVLLNAHTRAKYIAYKTLTHIVHIDIFLLPNAQILLEQLYDRLGVLELLLTQVIDFLHGRLERLIRRADRFVAVEHLEVEDGEVETDGEFYRAARLQRYHVCLLVGLPSLVH